MPVQRTKMNRILSLSPLSSSNVPNAVSVNSKFFADVAQSQENVQGGDQDPVLDDKMSTNSAVKEAYLSKNFIVYYPATTQERQTYRTKDGKRLTPHQWAVYDFARTIPKGKVTTYKEVASAIGGSPRSVGSALRNNPFSPYVPCHRVIASNLFIGGFFGEWGKDHKTGLRYNDKVAILSEEGVQFDDKGNLQSVGEALWRP